MSDRPSIASITVSYNSAETLRIQLKSLLTQTWPLDEIIVIDNCSHDSTIAVLKAEFPQVTVIALQRNEGIAGALAAGMSYAFATKGNHWVWLLDQDSIPQPRTLEKLVEGIGRVSDDEAPLGIVSSVPIEAGKAYPGLLWRGRFVPPSKESQKAPFWMVDATISSGSLVHRDVAAAVGLPRVDFFIDLVDFEYCLRVRKHGYRIYMIRDSVLHHTIGTPLRKQVLGVCLTWNDHVPWREYYHSRNFTYLVWHLYPSLKSKFYFFLKQLRHAVAIWIYSRERSASLGMLMRGFLDGRAGQLDNRFLPTDSSAPLSKSVG